MSTYLIDALAGVLRPLWTDMTAIGWLVTYLDALDDRPAEVQMAEGYARTAGTDPYPFEVQHFALTNDRDTTQLHKRAGLKPTHLDTKRPLVLKSLRYPDDDPYAEVSRTTAGDGSLVVMFDAAMTAVIRKGKLAWLARLD